MDFNPAQFHELIRRIEDGIKTVVSDANAAVQRIENDFGWIPGIGDMIKAALSRFVSLVEEFARKIAEALKYVEVPVIMWQYGQTWLDMAIKAGQVSSNLAGLQNYSDEWQGIAGGSYTKGVAKQEPAVDTIQARANQISGACTWTAVAGFGFYAGIAAVIAGLIVAIATAPSGFGLVAGIVVAAIGAAGAVASLLFGVEGQARSFEQTAEPTGNFPGDGWPQALATP